MRLSLLYVVASLAVSAFPLPAQQRGARAESRQCLSAVTFAGQVWDVHTGEGPLKAEFDRCNVRLDANGSLLNLRIVCVGGRCTSSEVATRRRYLFGSFQVQTLGRIDQLHPGVVFGIFTYPGATKDGTREIDIEYARYGQPKAPLANYVVYPDVALDNYRNEARSLESPLTNASATHRFTWRRTSVFFQSVNGHTDGDRGEAACWIFRPPNSDIRRIPQAAAPLLLNLYPYDAAPLPEGEYQITITAFNYTADLRSPSRSSACR